MTITQPENRFVKLTRGDDNFMMTDGIKMVPRSSLEFSSDCPKTYIDIIARCYENGWIKNIAYVKTKELFWEVLEQ